MFPLSLVVRHAKVPVRAEIQLSRLSSEVLEVALAIGPNAPVTESSGLEPSQFRRAPLEESVSRSLTQWLRELAAADLLEQPASPDGLTMTLESHGPGARRVVIGTPRGRAASVLGLLVHAAAWQMSLLGRGERPILDAVKSELITSDAPGLTRRCASKETVRFRAPSLGIEALEIAIDTDGPHASDGVRREDLHEETHLRVVSMVAALLATRTTRMGVGECLFEISFDGARVEVRCPEAGGEPVLAKLPVAASPTVRALFVLAGALSEEDATQRARDLSAWRTTLPWVSRPIRTSDLFLRFRMEDVRFGDRRYAWYRLDTHRTISRCDAGSADDEGRPVMPHDVTPEEFASIREALAACDALGVGTNPAVTPRDACPDDDRFIELMYQRPGARGLETTTAGWAYGRMAPRDRGPEMERGLDAVYALYQALMKIRDPADIR